ncbi:transposase, IS5 family [Halolamina pelagica]|uniref:Transposase, IS5 family n=1 Tax=Halolamina pelagica TaxID=699431 RepID=A0A1I5VTC3_9EURY|nr:transposase, IS5 family [Halolamina pelagica]
MKSYCEALDLLSEMPHILAEIGLEAGDLSYHSTLVKAFDRLEMKTWRVLLRLSAQLHDTADHAAMDATFFDRETASKHYCRRANRSAVSGILCVKLRRMSQVLRSNMIE